MPKNCRSIANTTFAEWRTLDVTEQQVETFLNEVVNHTNRYITKEIGAYVRVYKFQIYCDKDLANCAVMCFLRFISTNCGSRVTEHWGLGVCSNVRIGEGAHWTPSSRFIQPYVSTWYTCVITYFWHHYNCVLARCLHAVSVTSAFTESYSILDITSHKEIL